MLDPGNASLATFCERSDEWEEIPSGRLSESMVPLLFFIAA